MTTNPIEHDNFDHDIDYHGDFEDEMNGELEVMLEDAYQVPKLPRSLLKRIDNAVEQEWGESPNLSGRREPVSLSSVIGNVLKTLRSWPVAASLVVVIGLVALLQTGKPAYGWQSMMEALRRAPVVQIGDPSSETNVRWLSIPDRVLGERSGGLWRLVDFERRVELRRERGASQVTRKPFEQSVSNSPDAMFIAFLLNDQTDLRLTREKWSRNGDNVTLHVKFDSRVADSVALDIVLDDETHLPISWQAEGTSGDFVDLSYPATNSKELISKSFLVDLPIVDENGAVIQSDPLLALATDRVKSGAKADSTSAGIENKVGKSGAVEKPPREGAASLGWKSVEPSNLSSDEMIAQINQTLEALWKKHGIEPTEVASDEELLRRVFLDLAGRTPSVSEVRKYLDDKSTDRYVKLVDQLLDSRDHETHLATVWRTHLIPEGIDLSRFGGIQSFEKWMGKQFADNVPYDEIVRRLLLAEGRLSKSGPLLFYAAAKLDADQLATRSARVFLGMRLDCAKCHNDHFEPWLQKDFWGFAAFFARISRPSVELQNVSTVMQVRDVKHGDVMLPESNVVVPPRFLDGIELEEDPESAARRKQLANWITANDNPFFARAAVNRVWGQLFGKGVVEPVDGFGVQHLPRSQELLDLLASHFIGSGYDLRALFQTIVLSKAYQLSSGAETADTKRQDYFAQMNVKLLTAEQMYDCITVASMLIDGASETGFNLDRIGNSRRDMFLQQFRTPTGRTTEYLGGIPQALTLMNGGLIADATGLVNSGLLNSLKIPLITNRDRIEVLYLATLSRKPKPSEWDLLQGYVTEDLSGNELQESLADILWALLNSAEFTMNH